MTNEQFDSLNPMADLNEGNIATLSDEQLQHLIDCEPQIIRRTVTTADVEYRNLLQAEHSRRMRQSVLDNAIADACIAKLGDRGETGIDENDLFFGL